ncbi:MAG TPA: hypothetical protein VFJ07_10385 [Streptosporangiaceae bacterium]|nr:hypothetical protein [Streptosporangiaceae bacterium]
MAGPDGAGLLAAGLLATEGLDGEDGPSVVLWLLHPTASSARAAPPRAAPVGHRRREPGVLVLTGP